MPTLSDLDNFALRELDDFTLEDLNNMSYVQLLTAVQRKYQIAENQCDKSTPLSDEQVQAVTEIVHIYEKEKGMESLAKMITNGVAINVISAFLGYLAGNTIKHLPQIMEALKQAYILLSQLIQQAQA